MPITRQFKYRIYPTERQTTLLGNTLTECRWLYNHLLELRINTYKETGKSVGRYDCNNAIVALKLIRPSLCNIHSQVLQQVSERIELAFQAFFRRIRNGENPGFPRFKGEGWYDSFTYTQSGFSIRDDGKLRLSKIGDIKIVKHRPLEGEIKRLNIKRTATGKWFACFSVELEPKPLHPSSQSIGIDLGLKYAVTMSNGDTISPPKFFRQEEKELAKVQRKHSKEKTVHNKKRVARVHERISNKRLNWSNQLAHALISVFQVIVFEDLSIQKMQENGFSKGFNKSIADVAWRQLISATQSAAESAMRTVVLVDPRNTSQMCSQCGKMVPKSLTERVHKCDCGLVMDRDLNAARNILALGLQRLAQA